MSSKRAMKQAQKKAYAKHRSNITNNNFEIKKNVIKAYNHDDLLLFIKKNKTFDNSTFFQYYPFKLFNEVLNV